MGEVLTAHRRIGTRWWGRWSADFTVAATGCLLAVPYLVLGPGWILDDWIHLRNLQFDGWMQSGGYLWGTRPGAAAVFAGAFRIAGPHPVPMYLLQTALVVANAVQFRRLAVRFLPAPNALIASIIWLLLPIRSATEHWAATMNIVVATLLLLAGLGWLHDAVRYDRGWLRTGAALMAAVLCYEAVITVALAAVIVAAFATRFGRAPLLISGYLSVTGALMASVSPKRGGNAAMFDFLSLPSAHFGLDAVGAPASIVTISAMICTLVLIAARRDRVAAQMVGSGVAVIILGAMVFVQFRTQPFGTGDRVNATMAFGVALIFAATIRVLAGRHLAIGLAVAGLIFVPARIGRSISYAWAAEQATALIGERAPEGGTLTLEDCPTHRDNVMPFLGWWDVGAAVQYIYDDPSASGSFEWDAPMGRPSFNEPCKYSAL